LYHYARLGVSANSEPCFFLCCAGIFTLDDFFLEDTEATGYAARAKGKGEAEMGDVNKLLIACARSHVR